MSDPYADIARTDPPDNGPEQAMLDGFLDYHRATLALKCAGLSDEQLRRRAVPPSSLTLLGLVRHLAEVEAWFHDDLADGSLPGIYYTEQDPDGDFDNVDTDTGPSAFTVWQQTVARSREFTAAHGLDHVCAHSRRSDQDQTLRWVYLHMIEEYARHNGHADVLREQVDGVTGE